MKKNGESLEEWCQRNNRSDILGKWSDLNKIGPSEVAYGSDKKYKWRCRKGHNFEASPNAMTRRPRGNGCPYCSNQKVLAGFNDLASKEPEVASKWNHNKNGSLEPSCVLPGSGRVVWWLCDKGHEYKKSICEMRKNQSCPYCSNRKLLIGFNDLATKYPNLASEWHNGKNGCPPNKIIANQSHKGYWWICQKGHEFRTSLQQRIGAGSGCPVCAGKVIVTGFNDLESVYPEISKEWHPTKNGDIKPSDIASSSHKKYWWLCPAGHEYDASPAKRTRKDGRRQGCPICASEYKTSFPEQCIFYYLSKHFKNTKSRYVVDGNELDVYIPEINVGVEYDGMFYHTTERRPVEMRKDIFFANMGIRVIRVKECRKTPPDELGDNVIWINTLGNRYEAIKNTLLELAEKLQLGPVFTHVDIKTDSPKIMEGYYRNRKELSFAMSSPLLLKEWDYERNGNLNPTYLSSHSSRSVYWKCSLGHSYMASIDNRNKKHAGSGCPYCANLKPLRGFNDFETKCPELAKDWDYEKNRGIMPSEVLPSSGKQFYWKCKNGHSYKTSVGTHVKGHGCPYCSGRKPIQGKTDLQTLFPNIAKQWHVAKNGNLRPSDISSKSNKKVWWTCPKGHTYDAIVCDRTNNGSGCPYCSGRKVLAGLNDWATRFPEVAKRWHPTKNGSLSPTEVAPYSARKVWWIDELGKEYERRIDNEIQRHKNEIKHLTKGE